MSSAGHKIAKILSVSQFYLYTLLLRESPSVILENPVSVYGVVAVKGGKVSAAIETPGAKVGFLVGVFTKAEGLFCPLFVLDGRDILLVGGMKEWIDLIGSADEHGEFCGKLDGLKVRTRW